MNFQSFVESSIATCKPISREFEFGGEKITGYFLDLPALQVRELLKSEDPARDAAFLAAMLCDESGNPLLTVEQARTLKAPHMNALISEAFVVLGLTKDGRAEVKKP